jgi:hypothetical protein
LLPRPDTSTPSRRFETWSDFSRTVNHSCDDAAIELLSGSSMPRRGLRDSGGLVLHLLNRSVRRERLFFYDSDYQTFEDVMMQALVRVPTARLVNRAEHWRWGSLWRRCNSCDDLPLAAWPIPQSEDWTAVVNEPPMPSDLSAIQVAIRQGHPIGNQDWQGLMAQRFGLTLRQVGRPRK